jgi:hypothetical protein
MILTMTKVTIKHEYIFKKTTSNKLSETYKMLLPHQTIATGTSQETKSKKRQLTCKK